MTFKHLAFGAAVVLALVVVLVLDLRAAVHDTGSEETNVHARDGWDLWTNRTNVSGAGDAECPTLSTCAEAVFIAKIKDLPNLADAA